MGQERLHLELLPGCERRVDFPSSVETDPLDSNRLSAFVREPDRRWRLGLQGLDAFGFLQMLLWRLGSDDRDRINWFHDLDGVQLPARKRSDDSRHSVVGTDREAVHFGQIIPQEPEVLPIRIHGPPSVHVFHLGARLLRVGLDGCIERPVHGHHVDASLMNDKPFDVIRKPSGDDLLFGGGVRQAEQLEPFGRVEGFWGCSEFDLLSPFAEFLLEDLGGASTRVQDKRMVVDIGAELTDRASTDEQPPRWFPVRVGRSRQGQYVVGLEGDF